MYYHHLPFPFKIQIPITETSLLLIFRSASRLDYDLVRHQDTNTWTLTVSLPTCGPNAVANVALWCSKCITAGATGSRTTNEATAILSSTILDTLIATAPVVQDAAAHPDLGPTVVLVLQDGTLVDNVNPYYQEEMTPKEKDSKLSSRRSLQQDPTCSGPLPLGTTSIPFDYCEIIYTNFNFYYSLIPSGSGGTVLKGGIWAKTKGWAAFARSPDGTMVGSDAIIVYPDTAAASGVSVTGITLPSYDAAAINAAMGSFPISNTTAVKNADGALAATFTITLPESPETFSATPMTYLYVIDGVMAPNNNQLRGHFGGGMVSGGNLQFKLSSTATPGAPATPTESPPPPPVNSPPAVPVGSPSPNPPSGTTQTCSLTVANVALSYRVCYSVPFRSDFMVYYSFDADPLDAKSSILSMGIQGKSSGWIAVGFPTNSGQMTNAGAAIVKSCPTCSTRAAINQYWMSGTDASDVDVDTRMNITAMASSSTNGILSGSWKVKLPGVSANRRRRSLLQLNFPASEFPLIYALGTISSSGSLEKHTLSDSGDGQLDLLVGLPGATNGDGEIDPPISVNDGLAIAHMWIASITWGVIIPLTIMISRYLQPHKTVWFTLHRVFAVCGLILALVAVFLGFKANNGWETTKPVHRNLGITCTVLGLVQAFSLIPVVRPKKDHKLRPYWFFGHAWIGRSAAILGISNIYYGIIHVEELGTWAWATYTAVLLVIVLVSGVMEVINYKKRQQIKNDDDLNSGIKEPIRQEDDSVSSFN